MFEPSDQPRIFGVPPGVDYPKAVVEGLLLRLRDTPPHQIGRVQIFVNTRRMARRLREIFDAGPAGFVPRIRLITDLANDPAMLDIPPAVPPLRRRLELVQLLSRLLDSQPDLAPRSSLFALADSLMKLMDEMQGEGVPPTAIAGLDVSDQSGHWERALQFINIVQDFFGDTTDAPDNEARQRRVIEALCDLWQTNPPTDPIIVAGSTGSRGATAMLMGAVANLPQGAIILPGFDDAMPLQCWDDLSDALTAEDHPQYRFRKLLDDLGCRAEQVQTWTDTAPANPARNALVSLALRPAPVTDQWLRDGPKLTNIDHACRDITLVEVPNPRAEALAIALRLREAAEQGQTAALITPDRTLTRQVQAALLRWNIVADDSAGIPLPQTPAGRLLRHVGGLLGQTLSSEALLTLLKHPLTHQADRGPHRLWVQSLELHLRKNGPPFPTRQAALEWAEGRADPGAAGKWVHWVFDTLEPLAQARKDELSALLETHITATERLTATPADPQAYALWDKDDGQKAHQIIAEMRDEAHLGGELSAQDYASLFNGVLSTGEIRNSATVHPNILIWGTLEARVQGADLLILSGLNEGTWPERPDPDPWMNRAMRQKAGLLLPERRIGLAAHDFQQGIAAPEVWLTRAAKSDDAETVPSRWINRLTNLLGGLSDQGGDVALDAMRQRGELWLDRAEALEKPTELPKYTRPAPRPPLAARPKRLSVTAIKTLIRDPYAIYARNVLGLKPLDPLVQTPDAPLRGTLIHEVLERFVQDWQDEPPEDAKARLLEISDTILAQNAPWPTARALWRAKIERFADWFIALETQRQTEMTPVDFETDGAVELERVPFRLTAQADRIDRDSDGSLHIFDYKTGAPPSPKEQTYFDKQLLLEATMAARGAFAKVGAGEVADARYIGLGSDPKEVPAPLENDGAEKTWDELHTLISAYLEPDKGFTSRDKMQKDRDEGRYDHLARFGEWDVSDAPEPEDLT